MTRVVRRVLAGAFMGCALAGGLAACGSKENSSDRIVRTADKAPSTAVSGLLKSVPPALTLDAVDREAAGSARRAVLQTLFFAQWGDYPSLVAAYAPALQAAIDRQDIAGAWSQHRETMAVTEFNLLSTVNGPGGTLVTLRLSSMATPPSQESFLLRKVNGQWRIVFDTLLEKFLPQWVQYERDPSATTPGRAAVEAALTETKALRAVAITASDTKRG